MPKIIKTNGDRFRNMSDQNIMKLIIKNFETAKICKMCVPNPGNYQPNKKLDIKCDGFCIAGVLRYLEQPVERR